MAHRLPDLPYAHDALEPHIDTETMGIHHGKHHQAYVTNLNAALEGHPELQDKSAFELLVDFQNLPDGPKPAVQKHGGGHVNHSMFWTLMSGAGGGEPGGALAAEIDATFGSFDEFKSAFAAAAGGVFGSGWAWLAVDGTGQLKITTTANQDSPVFTEGSLPILGVDVWEHAYYLRYQNRRPEYLQAFFQVVNWDQVAAYFASVRAGEGVIAQHDWAAATRAEVEGVLGALME